ncbi:hypothetical protein KAS08_05730 [Candidatus Pacearchaeota archaeon]|nr:hypothetical protein [Candidatus Pacearchaeota archaeon]
MKKKIELKYKIDMVMILVSVFVLMGIVGFSQPLVIAPLDELETFDTEVLFTIEKGEKLLIDDNLDFTTPDEYEVEDGLKINLKPGKYYWKVVGMISSEVRTLTINSKVSLEFVEGETDFDVVNAGNIKLNVDIYNGTEKVGEKKLSPGEEVVGDGTKFIGEQNDD